MLKINTQFYNCDSIKLAFAFTRHDDNCQYKRFETISYLRSDMHFRVIAGFSEVLAVQILPDVVLIKLYTDVFALHVWILYLSLIAKRFAGCMEQSSLMSPFHGSDESFSY